MVALAERGPPLRRSSRWRGPEDPRRARPGTQRCPDQVLLGASRRAISSRRLAATRPCSASARRADALAIRSAGVANRGSSTRCGLPAAAATAGQSRGRAHADGDRRSPSRTPEIVGHRAPRRAVAWPGAVVLAVTQLRFDSVPFARRPSASHAVTATTSVPFPAFMRWRRIGYPGSRPASSQIISHRPARIGGIDASGIGSPGAVAGGCEQAGRIAARAARKAIARPCSHMTRPRQAHRAPPRVQSCPRREPGRRSVLERCPPLEDVPAGPTQPVSPCRCPAPPRAFRGSPARTPGLDVQSPRSGEEVAAPDRRRGPRS